MWLVLGVLPLLYVAIKRDHIRTLGGGSNRHANSGFRQRFSEAQPRNQIVLVVFAARVFVSALLKTHVCFNPPVERTNQLWIGIRLDNCLESPVGTELPSERRKSSANVF